MIDQALGLQPVQKRNGYYFQFYPNFVSIKEGGTYPSEGQSIKFAIFKGPQTFSKNRLPLKLSLSQTNQSMALKKAQLNFYIADYAPNRKSTFIIKLFLLEEDIETEVGEFNVEASNLVQMFENEKKNSVRQTEEIGDFIVDFDIYTEKSRMLLEKLVKENREKDQERSPTYDKGTYRESASQASSQTKPKRFERVQKQDSPRFKIQPKKREEKPIQKVQEPTPEVQEQNPKKEEVQVIETPQEETKPEEQKIITSSPERQKSQSKENSQRKVKKTQSIEEIASPKPALGGRVQKSTVLKVEDMKTSTKMKSSVKHAPEAKKEQGGGSQTMYTIKMVIFLLISFFLMYEAMAPSRKVPYKKKI